MTATDTPRTDVFVRLDPTTGAGTIIGTVGDPDVYGLGYSNGTLHGADYHGNLLTINPATGAGTIIATGGRDVQGMATQPISLGTPIGGGGGGGGGDGGSRTGRVAGMSCATKCLASTAKPRVTENRHVLRCSRGSWTNDPTAYTYQWYRNGAALARASKSSYTLGTLDEGTRLTCAVTARNVAGQGRRRATPCRSRSPTCRGAQPRPRR